MSDTPITDAATWDADLGNMVVHASVAKELELRIAALREQLKEYQKDAQRYRWAKDNLFLGYIDDDVVSSWDDDQIDAAIGVCNSYDDANIEAALGMGERKYD